MSPQAPPPGWVEYKEPTPKLLGAHIALNTDNPRAAETAALMAKAEKGDEAAPASVRTPGGAHRPG
jgi:hypothetical protein